MHFLATLLVALAAALPSQARAHYADAVCISDGLDVLDRIESTLVAGESPTTRIDLIRVRHVE